MDKIRVIVHLETSSTDGRITWQAESPDIPGYLAASNTLAELLEVVYGDLEHLYGLSRIEVQPILEKVDQT